MDESNGAPISAITPTEEQRIALGDLLVKLCSSFDLQAGGHVVARRPKGGVVVLNDIEREALLWALLPAEEVQQ